MCLHVCECASEYMHSIYSDVHCTGHEKARTLYIVQGTRRRVRAGGEADPPGQMGRAGEQLARSVVQ